MATRSARLSTPEGEAPDRAPDVRVLPSPIAPPPKKAAEVIAEHFRRDIANGVLQAGASLPAEGELVAHFGVSRPTLRAAFRILESEGLLTIARGAQGGPRVCHPNIEATARNLGLLLHLRGARISEFFYARSVIEPAAAALFAETRPARGLTVLRSTIAAEEAAVGQPDTFTEVAIGFYEAITEFCGNDVFALFGAVLRQLLSEMSTFLVRHDRLTRQAALEVLAAHRKLFQLLETGKSAEAQKFWGRHIHDLATLSADVQGLRFDAFE